jgi:amino acid transporter
MNEPGEVPAHARKANFFQLAGAVFWAFFGVRKSAALAEDVKNLNPVHVIIAGIVGALVFIAALILIVNWVIGSGVAAAR